MSCNFSTMLTGLVPILPHTDDLVWIWWYDRAGAIQTSGLNFLIDMPYFLAFLAIIQRFDGKAWGFNSVFTASSNDSLTFTVSSFDSHKVEVTIDDDKKLYLSLFGHGGAVIPARSRSLNPLFPDKTLEDVELVAKIYLPDNSRMSEADLLRKAYTIAATEDDVRGHLPVLIGSHTWPDTFSESIRRFLHIGDRPSRHLRILVFIKLQPITALSGKEFLKAYWDCFLCAYSTFGNL